ncbi:MAG: hypothetical protein RIF37_06305 [Rhodospirillaceae bacterium]
MSFTRLVVGLTLGITALSVVTIISRPELIFGESNFRPRVSTSAEPIEIQVGGKLLSIPSNYIVYEKDRVTNEQDLISLHALLPDLLPVTEANKTKFTGRLDPNVIRIYLRPSQRSYIEGLEARAKLFDKEISRKAGPFGLTKLELVPLNPNPKIELFVFQLSDETEIALECFIKDDIQINPTCKTQNNSNGISVGYFFSRENLPKFQSIENGVRNLISTFVVDNPVTIGSTK